MNRLTPIILGVLMVTTFIEKSFGAKILFYNIISTSSHIIMMHPLALKLADHGHSVTFLSTVKVSKEDERINYFYPEKATKMWLQILATEGDPEAQIEARRNGDENTYTTVAPWTAMTCEALMDSHDFQDWLRHKETAFDLMVINACYNDCGLGLAHKFRAPHIIFQTASFSPWHVDLYGIPLESSWIPDFRLNYTQQMNFFQRLYNTLYTLEMHVIKMSSSYYPQLEKILRTGLQDPAMPDITELAKDARLILVNSYFAAEYGRSFPPFVIPVGGLHCQITNDTLPNNIDDFVSKFPAGFIYVSFGTVSRPSPKLEASLLQVLGVQFPEIGFVFKWTGKLPENELAANILPVTWAPQQTLLAHPKIRGFLSHAGMLSIQEAAFFGVPVIVIPGRAEQDYNAECLVRLGVAVRLELVDLTTNHIEEAVRKILYDPSYKSKMEKLSQVYRDRPQHPLETALWWTEFVIRNEGKGNDLRNMQPLGIHQNWIQRRLIDVWAFIFIIFLIVLITTFKLLIVVKTVVCKSFNGNEEKKKKRS